jgi:hypothetical protein
VRTLAPKGALLALFAALPVAFLAYEAAIYAGTLLLSHGEGAFNTDVVFYVALVEVVAFLALLIAHRLAVAAGLIEANAVERAV